MQLKEIDSAEPLRGTPRIQHENKRPWNIKLRKPSVMKLFGSGLGLFVVSSCLMLFLGHQNGKIARMNAKLSASENRIFNLEKRLKREVAQQPGAKKHSIAKRSATDQVTISPGTIPPDVNVSGPSTSGGAVYTRWGRRDCPHHAPSSLIYHGIGAGSYYSHTGGGSEHLCLHRNVSYQMGSYIEGNQGSSYIYGMEWRDSTWISPLFDLSDTMTNNIQYHSVPCALCLAIGRAGKVMIPGRADCPRGWTHEYDGYIMSAGHSDKHSSENICVDRRPQVVAGTQGAQNGRHVYMVETQCTSLLCEPVVAGREISCVVCTL